VVSGNAGEGVAAYRSLRNVIDLHITDMVAGIGADGEGPVRSVVNRGVSRRYRPVGTGAGGDGVGVNGECSGYGVVGGNAVEGVAAYRSLRDVIDLHILDMVAGIGADGECLVRTGVNHHVAGG